MRWFWLVGVGSLFFGHAAGAACAAVSTTPLRLLPAIARALCASPQLAEQGALRDEALALVEQRRAAQAPVLSLQAQPALQSLRVNGAGSQSRSLAVTAVLSRTLWDQGAIASRLQQAEQLAEGAGWQRLQTAQERSLAVIGAYVDLLGTQAQIDASRQSLSEAAASADAAAAREAAGAGTRVDVLRAQASLAQAQLDLQSAGHTLARQRVALLSQLDLSPDTALELPGQVDADATSTLPSPRTPSELAAEIERALQVHPDLRRLGLRIAAAEANLAATLADRAGVVTWTAQAGPLWSSTALGALSTSAGVASRQWNAQTSLLWSRSFSDGGSGQALVGQARAQLDAELARLQTRRRERVDEVWQNWTTWRNAEDIRAQTAVALRASVAAEAATQARFRAGVGTLTDVLSAQSALATTRKQAAQADVDIAAALLRLAGSLGRLPLPADAGVASAAAEGGSR